MMGSLGVGQATPADANSETNTIAFMVRQIVARCVTSKLVLVQAVHGGGVDVSGTVDVLPLVQQIDGNGKGTPHGTVSGLPWSRLQGGKNAVICDPAVGDVGYVVAMDRDISSVKAQGAGLATTTGYVPNLRRQFDLADGVYAGGALCVAPDQYLIFTETGVRIVDKNGCSLEFSATGFSVQDALGNSITSDATGMTQTITGGNKIIMAAGFVNIVAPVLQVNGTPVTIP